MERQMILQNEQRDGGTKTPSLSSGEAGKLPRRFLQHMANGPIAAQAACGEWVFRGWSVSVETGHDRLLGNRSCTRRSQSQWPVVGHADRGTDATRMTMGVM